MPSFRTLLSPRRCIGIDIGVVGVLPAERLLGAWIETQLKA
jgi:hypothetical protein